MLSKYTKKVISQKIKAVKYVDSKKCPKCNKEFEVIRWKEKDGNILYGYETKYCSQHCANSHIQTKEINKKRSDSLIKTYSKTHNIRKIQINCKRCNKIFETSSNSHRKYCSRKCAVTNRPVSLYTRELLRKSGLKSAEIQSENRRSKNEALFATLCTKEFKNVKTNVRIFNGWDADIILEDHKIAVLWNGNWHHIKLTRKHSVLQVQVRDKIKQQEIISVGYTPYVIDDYGKYNEKFVNSEFNKLKSILCDT